MAYVSKELKAKVAPVIKALCKKYGVKASLAVNNHSTLVLNIASGQIDFLESFNRVNADEPRPAHIPFQPAKTYIQVNEYHYQRHFDGKALEFLLEAIPAMDEGNHCYSDPSGDFSNVGWYVNVNIGRWDRPYVLTA